MKKYLIMILILLLLPLFVYAETCDTSSITITSIEKINSTGYTEEIEEPTIDNTSVSTNLKLYDVGDSITYEIKVKNKSNKDYDLNKRINNSEYVSYEIISNDNKVKSNEEKTIELKIEYKKKLPDELYKSNKFIENKQIDLIVEDYIINPSTGRNIIITLLIVVFVVLSILSIKKDLKYKSVILLLFIPLFVNAACEYKLSINSRIELKKILPNPCTYEGELVQGAEYVNGQYTYRYKQEFLWDFSAQSYIWKDFENDGWGVTLTDKESTTPVTTKLCSSINNKPITSMSSMFADSQASSIDLTSFDTSNVTNMHSMFEEVEKLELDLSNFNTSNVTDMSEMFYYSKIPSLDLSGFDTSNVTDMSYMFDSSHALTINLSSFDTGNVINMEAMFASSYVNDLDLSNFNTSKVTNMICMFDYCEAKSINLSSFDTSKVTDMYGMFAGVKATVLDLSSFNTSKVTDMSNMLSETKTLNLDLSSFDTSNVTNMNHMFYKTEAVNINVSSFNTTNVTQMVYMFSKTKAESLDLSSFDMRNVSDLHDMFYLSQSTIGYGRTQADCDKLNTSSYKPSGLVFVVKES